MAITNSIKNILTGFGATGQRGGAASGVGTPPPVSVLIVFPVGQAGISVGYAKVKMTQLSGGANPFPTGVVVWASDQVNLNEAVAMASFPAGITIPNGWLSELIFPFCGDRQYTWFRVDVACSAGTTNVNIDFEVWGNSMAGGQ